MYVPSLSSSYYHLCFDSKKFKNKNLFLVAATLRPETMYGQTNCFVLPEGEYGVFKMRNNDEHYIMSERAAKNMAYQELTAEDKNFTPLAKVKGTELIGKRVKAPLTTYEHVFVLPLPTISSILTIAFHSTFGCGVS